MTRKELDDVLVEHKKWLEGKGGKRADLSNENFENCNLRGVDLRKAILSYDDFDAAEKMANGSKQKLLDSMNYKSKINESIISHSKSNKNAKNKKNSSHPSWPQRKEYVDLGTFDEKLIRQIAEETDCINETLIRNVCSYYTKIKLI